MKTLLVEGIRVTAGQLLDDAAQVPPVYLAFFAFAGLLVAALVIGAIAERIGARR